MHLKRGGLPSKRTPPPLLPCCCCCCCFCWCVIIVIISTVVKNFSSGQGQKYISVLRCRVILDELSSRHSGISKCVCTCNARCLRRAYAARPQLQANEHDCCSDSKICCFPICFGYFSWGHPARARARRLRASLRWSGSSTDVGTYQFSAHRRDESVVPF